MRKIVERISWIGLASIAAMSLAWGCAQPPQTIVVQPTDKAQVSTRLGSGRLNSSRVDSAANRAEQAPAPSAESAKALEPAPECEARLHDLAGHLLLYYAVNRRFPDQLEELTSVVESFDERSVTCPVSHQIYFYAPRGRSAPGQTRLLVLCDPTPAHGGLRWAVMIDPPTAANQSPVPWVVPLPETLALQYAADDSAGDATTTQP